jgi:hypothetical protein
LTQAFLCRFMRISDPSGTVNFKHPAATKSNGIFWFGFRSKSTENEQIK